MVVDRLPPNVHKIVALVLPLPNPSDPRQHEACCPLCKQPDLSYRKAVALNQMQQSNLKCANTSLSVNSSLLYSSSMLPSSSNNRSHADCIFLDSSDRFSTSQDLLQTNSDDELVHDDGNHV